MLRKLKPKYLSIAKGDELARGIANYMEKWVFPVCAGAIDDTHIPISTPQQKSHWHIFMLLLEETQLLINVTNDGQALRYIYFMRWFNITETEPV